YTGQLYELASSHMNAVCDDKHRWLINTQDDPQTWNFQSTNQIVAHHNNKWHKRDGAIVSTSHSIPLIPKNSNPLYTFPEVSFIPTHLHTNTEFLLDFCTFIGIVMTQGTIISNQLTLPHSS